MSKRDVLDKEMARQFAWRMTPPEAPAPPEEPDELDQLFEDNSEAERPRA